MTIIAMITILFMIVALAISYIHSQFDYHQLKTEKLATEMSSGVRSTWTWTLALSFRFGRYGGVVH
jgi:LPS O-antigen subunit length determinant protein (WzzB/FepE family)